MNNELRPDTFIGVFSLDFTGLRPVFPFSNRRENLVKAVELASVNQLPHTCTEHRVHVVRADPKLCGF